MYVREGGVRKAVYRVGESVAETIMSRIQVLSSERAEELVKSYGDLARRQASRFMRHHGRSTLR